MHLTGTAGAPRSNHPPHAGW